MEILSRRNVTNWPSWHLVWEWEDIISERAGWDVILDNPIFSKPKVYKIPFLTHCLLPKDNVFMFDMTVFPDNTVRRYNSPNFYPCIIDFFLKDDELSFFEKKYNENKLIFISSKEVYDHLMKLGISIPIKHLPLSLPDKYKLNVNTVLDKKFDAVLVGRQNPVLKAYLIDYAKKHPSFVYVVEDDREGRKFHYYTSKGDYVGYYETRSQYMELISKSRIALYATPGIDGGEYRTNGYNQVTPKFLEYIYSGCHIIARWEDNSDTDFYHIGEFSDNIQSFQQFEMAVEKALSEKLDMRMYSKYLENHYTSKRVELLNYYLKGIL